MTSRRPLIPAAVAFLLAAAPAAAQSIHGTLVEEGTVQPVAGAFVTLLDSAGAQIDAALTDADGRFIVVAPAPGKYMVGIDRIGYMSTHSEPIELGAGQIVQYRLATLVEPVELADIGVTVESDCTVRPAEGEEASRLWQEARKALLVTAFTQRRGLLRYAVTARERVLDPFTLHVRRERERSRTGFSQGSPYVALPARALADEGFVRFEGEEVTYYGPDAETLLSDTFLDGHCFEVRAPSAERPGWVGLAFAPSLNRRLPDIAGTLWIDVPTAELRLLEYEYVNLPAAMEGKGAGGRIEFDRLASGEAYISEWWIRMPVVRVADHRAYAHLTMDTASRLTTVLRIEEDSGEVDRIVPTRVAAGDVAVARAEGRWSEPLELPPPPPPAPRVTAAGGDVAIRRMPGGGTARLIVTARDAGTHEPLEGAQVHLPGLQLGGSTDAAGRLELPGVPPGEREVRVQRLGYRSMEATISLAAGEAIEVETRLVAAPVEVEELAATIEPPPDMGIGLAGTVITADQIPRETPLHVIELIDRRVPGTRVGRSSTTGCPIVETRSGRVDLVVIDGQSFRDTCVLDMVQSTDIRRLEMRSGLNTSAEFGRSTGGSIFIETFHAGE